MTEPRYRDWLLWTLVLLGMGVIFIYTIESCHSALTQVIDAGIQFGPEDSQP